MAQHVSARIYGEIQGVPPFDANTISRVISYNTQSVGSFPVPPTTFYPLSTGIQMANGSYVYSAIVSPASGLQVHDKVLVTDQTVAQLATSAG